MHGEFKIHLKKEKENAIVTALEDMYSAHNLSEAHSKSQFNFVDISLFKFGFINSDVILLGSITDGILKINLESIKNQFDLIQLKNRIDEYHFQIRNGFKKRGLRNHESSAIITLEKSEIAGTWPNNLKDFGDEFRKKSESFFIQPLAAIVVAFLAFHNNIFSQSEYKDGFKKTFITLAESSVAMILLFVIKAFFKKTEKRFKFTI